MDSPAWLGAPTAFAAGASIGALVGWGRHRLEWLNGAFAGLAGVGLGLLATQAFGLPALAETVLSGALGALMLVPSALVWHPRAKVPSTDETEDDFTRERQLATARHLQSLLGHAQQIRLEHARSQSMQEYALAYLEEARMGLALARALPSDAAPSRLGEVLDRLRSHAQESETRRKTAREVSLA